MISRVSAFVWGPATLLLFVGTGLYFSVRSGFFQLFGARLWFGKTLLRAFRERDVRKTDEKGAVSQLQALFSSLAACMGTGNIVGVATALCAGGAGAVFWMWISAALGMMTCCAENILGIKYRRRLADGTTLGGSMYYIEHAFRSRIPAAAFSLFCAGSALSMGNMTQSSSLAAALENGFSVPKGVSAVLLCIVTLLIISGGVKRIARVAEKTIPPVSAVFLLGCLIVIAAKRQNIPAAAHAIFSQAFGLRAAAGGFAGAKIRRAIRYGVSRGVFSNEAGLGSSPIIHSAAAATSPAVQGMWGITEVFLDTVVMCTVTAFTLLCSGVCTNTANAATLCSGAFESVFGTFGGRTVDLCVAVYAFATLIGWSYYGEKATEYVFGKKGVPYYRAVYALCVLPGVLFPLEAVWETADIFNALMAMPNLAAVLLLGGEAVKELHDYKTMNHKRLMPFARHSRTVSSGQTDA